MASSEPAAPAVAIREDLGVYAKQHLTDLISFVALMRDEGTEHPVGNFDLDFLEDRIAWYQRHVHQYHGSRFCEHCGWEALR